MKDLVNDPRWVRDQIQDRLEELQKLEPTDAVSKFILKTMVDTLFIKLDLENQELDELIPFEDRYSDDSK